MHLHRNAHYTNYTCYLLTTVQWQNAQCYTSGVYAVAVALCWFMSVCHKLVL